MQWHEGSLAVLDLEATGVDPRSARIIEVGLFRFEVDGTSSPIVDQLIDPGVDLPARITELTGIGSLELASMGKAPEEVLAATLSAIEAVVDEGVPIVIYNVTYDWPLLAAELRRHDLGLLPRVPPAILIDPLVLDRHAERFRRGSRNLKTVAARYGVRLDDAHRAAGDAAATAGVARKIAERYPEFHLDGPEIVALEIEAHGRWKKSFNEFLTKKGKTDSLVTEVWPTG